LSQPPQPPQPQQPRQKIHPLCALRPPLLLPVRLVLPCAVPRCVPLCGLLCVLPCAPPRPVSPLREPWPRFYSPRRSWPCIAYSRWPDSGTRGILTRRGGRYGWTIPWEQAAW
jgi:hypothetical protein